ncbi:MAG: PSD1 and planctomycete cytochrome C domain-containing protein [Fuerstiella sp.]|nr:PSD1 and planctomycete cytochrome C domain-containing protein [Fuerstiella sp.]
MNAYSAALTLIISVVAAAPVAAQQVSFQRQVRSILSDKCFRCHGPDAAERQAGLRLDLEDDAKKVLKSGVRAIVPGKSADSQLVARIVTTDADLKMPPQDSGQSLSAAEVDILRRWVAQGAQWGTHWAFTEVERPDVPGMTDTAAEVTEIDHFVRSRLLENRLTPGVDANRIALIRRVTLDLNGLPPTIAEVKSFVADTSPTAYETVVQRLLSSPRFGEHMARYWLDAARYGDTHGLHLDNYREMWAYRDWVVNAFNQNKPFDVFTIEQLAGDLLENPTDEQIVATGFNRCHVTTSEGGSIAEEVHVRNVVDRVVTTGTVFMGLTLDCTRCHDHKFDPLTMKDFYSLYAYFNSIDGAPLDGNKKDPAPVLKVLTGQQKQQVADLETKRATLQQELKQYLASIEYVEPETPQAPIRSEPKEFVWVEDSVPSGAKSQGNTPWNFVQAPAPVFSGQSSSERTATGLSQHLFDNAPEPLTIGADDVFFCYVHLDAKNPPKEIMLQWNDGSWNHRAYWGGDHIDWGKANSVSRRRMADLPKLGEWVRLEVPVADVGFKPGAKVKGWAFTQFDGTVHWDKAGVVSKTDQQPLYDSFAAWQKDQLAAKRKSLPKNVLAVLTKSADKRTEDEAKTLTNYFLEFGYVASHKTVAPLQDDIKKSADRLNEIRKSAPTTLVFREKKEPKPAHMLTRGEYEQKGQQVSRAVPAVLPELPQGAPSNRLGLARWLTADNHPLTSRVTVNRIWQQFFGTGLVKTAEDFGSQGEAPTHPLLLDWLCAEFMMPQLDGAQHDWDVKHLVRLIVMSAAYRQSANLTSADYEKDPENRYLSRGPRFRMDAEQLRDHALHVGGLLSERMGGPSVKPPQPDGLWFAVGYSGSNTVRFKKDEGSDKVHRRTLYTFIKRTAPPPQMSTFDAPSREACVVRRERTNSPLQALLLMNDPQYVECARGLAERSFSESGPTPTERAAWMLQQAVLREPSATEVQGLVADYEANLADYQADPESAKRLLKVGETKARGDVVPEEFAAWTMVGNLILNLDEVINK